MEKDEVKITLIKRLSQSQGYLIIDANNEARFSKTLPNVPVPLHDKTETFTRGKELIKRYYLKDKMVFLKKIDAEGKYLIYDWSESCE